MVKLLVVYAASAAADDADAGLRRASYLQATKGERERMHVEDGAAAAAEEPSLSILRDKK